MCRNPLCANPPETPNPKGKWAESFGGAPKKACAERVSTESKVPGIRCRLLGRATPVVPTTDGSNYPGHIITSNSIEYVLCAHVIGAQWLVQRTISSGMTAASVTATKRAIEELFLATFSGLAEAQSP